MSDFDLSMLEIFREEVETHCETLGSGLLAIEQDQSSSRIEPLMRAAHSIKGAARIVGIEPAVKVAHVMEDVLVAAQKGKLTLTSDGIDVLLRGTDFLAAVGQITREPPSDWSTFRPDELVELVKALEGVAAGRPIAAAPPVASAAPVALAAPVAPAQPAAAAPAAAAHRAITVTSDAPQSRTVTIRSAIDAALAEPLRQTLLAQLSPEVIHLRIDLSEATGVDLTGLALLVAFGKHVEHAVSPPQLEVVRVHPALEDVFKATGLDATYHMSPANRTP